MTTIYDHLLGLVNKRSKFAPLTEKETDRSYLSRLTHAVSGSTKDDFDAMPEEAQEWFDLAAEALNEERPEVPVPDGYDREMILHPPPPAKPKIGRPKAAAKERAETEERALEQVERVVEAEQASVHPESTERPEKQPAASTKSTEGTKRAADTGARTATAKRTAGGRFAANRKSQPLAVNDGAAISTMIRRLVVADEKAPVDQIAKLMKQRFKVDMSKRKTTISTVRYDTIATLRVIKEYGWKPPA
ncbi:MAG: hypothetical protein J2P48_07635 [Alphaproteobacteria bacterium]|nr:hypothetical protein [Alphaproteobacteria bacterium]